MLALNQKQKAILVGTILGDGHLEQNGRHVRLRLDQGIKQADYLAWKYDEFKNLATANPRFIKEFHKRKNVFVERMHFSTYSDEVFDKWQALFYKNRTKIVPRNISEILVSPLSLAVWFMDDGYKRNDCNALRISTDSFSLREHKLLVDCLLKNFSIHSVVHRKGEAFNIYIPQASSQKFCDIIRPYMIDSLLYKVSLTP